MFTKLALILLLTMGCGFAPIKPFTPIGCRDIQPVCECDARGQNCHYVWVCVRNSGSLPKPDTDVFFRF